MRCPYSVIFLPYWRSSLSLYKDNRGGGAKKRTASSGPFSLKNEKLLRFRGFFFSLFLSFRGFFRSILGLDGLVERTISASAHDSIICRNVKIGKGAKVSRSIILSNVSIGSLVTLSDVVIDKYSIVTARHTIAGDPANVIYLKQGAIL